MIGRLLVHLMGGWWAQRQRLLAARGPWRRLLLEVYRANLREHGSYISPRAIFAGRPVLPHGPTGIFIAPRARIGRDVTIYQQVTIGANDRPGSAGFGSPTVGDGVVIYAGAQLVGRVDVGPGAVIGAGAVVARDVPARAVVVCAPVRVLPGVAS